MALEIQNAVLLFTKIMFNNLFAGACAQIKHLSLQAFRFLSIYFFASPFSLLLLLLLQFLLQFPRKCERGKNYYHGQAKGGKANFAPRFSLTFKAFWYIFQTPSI